MCVSVCAYLNKYLPIQQYEKKKKPLFTDILRLLIDFVNDFVLQYLFIHTSKKIIVTFPKYLTLINILQSNSESQRKL